MNKYALLMVMVFFLLLTTVIADSVLVTYSADLTGSIGNSSDATISGVLGLLRTFFRILTFQLEGFPVILNALVFLPITFTVLYMILDILKDIVPFT